MTRKWFPLLVYTLNFCSATPAYPQGVAVLLIVKYIETYTVLTGEVYLEPSRAVAVHIKHDLPDDAAALEQHEALIDGVGRKREGLVQDRCEPLGAPKRLGAVGHGRELLKVFSVGVGQDECGVSLLPAQEFAEPHGRLAVDGHVLWPALPARRRQPRPSTGPVVLARTWLGAGVALGLE